MPYFLLSSYNFSVHFFSCHELRDGSCGLLRGNYIHYIIFLEFSIRFKVSFLLLSFEMDLKKTCFRKFVKNFDLSNRTLKKSFKNFLFGLIAISIKI